jgi:hypothetical protein
MRRSILLPPNRGRQILAPTQVGSTGRVGQIRQGRVLTNADFTDQGLSPPRALWNLSNTSDASGNSVTLTNAGGVTFGSGITGAGTEAAIFPNSGTNGFLSAPNSIKQRFGTWGCWFRTTPTSHGSPTAQIIMSMIRTTGDYVFEWVIEADRTMSVTVYDGTVSNFIKTIGYGAVVSDDAWHFGMFTWDGASLLLYLDGYLIGNSTTTGGSGHKGPMHVGGTGLLYIGARQVDTNRPFAGRIDEAFVTDQILKPHHMDFLRAVKIPHGLPSPRMVRAVRYHYDKTSTLAASDFTSQPLVGYNFLSGQLTTDHYGSLGKTLSATGSPTESPSPDGSTGGAALVAASNQSFGASDSSLPAGNSSRTLGLMMRRRIGGGFETLASYGTYNVSGQEFRLDVDSAGRLRLTTGTAVAAQTFLLAEDTGWLWIHWVYDHNHPGGVRHRLYINGTCHMVATDTLNTVLGGAGKFRIGENPDGSANADMTIQNLYITNYAQQPDEIRRIVDKQGDLIGVSQVPTDDFLVDISSTDIYCIFTGVSPRDSIELTVEN